MPLTDAQIRNAKPADRAVQLMDGFGLYLEIRPTGARYWRVRYWLDGKDSRTTIGRYPAMGLKEARIERDRIRQLVSSGVSPAAERKADKLLKRQQANDTFERLADDWLMRRREKWTDYYYRQAESCLRQNAYPMIGQMPAKSVTSAHVLAVLQAMEKRGVRTYAIQLRQWISAIYRFGIVTLRADNDPAQALKGAIERPATNHARALTAEEIAKFKAALDAYKGNRTTVLAMRLLLYTFVRNVEARMATWDEFSADVWTVPAGRMKMRRTHLVPLSRQVLSLLEELRGITGGGVYLFPNCRDPKSCMSATTVNRALEYMGQQCVTAHDFRATASTHLNEMGFRPDVIERQLAHVEGNKTRRSYNHAEYMPERIEMMQAWADWVDACQAAMLSMK